MFINRFFAERLYICKESNFILCGKAVLLVLYLNVYSRADTCGIADEDRALRELKYGMFIHFSLSTFDGKEQTPDNTTPVSIYQPANLDLDQWIQVAASTGMKYAVLKAKHSSGLLASVVR